MAPVWKILPIKRVKKGLRRFQETLEGKAQQPGL